MMCVDKPERAKDIAPMVSDAIADGGYVERVTVVQARAIGFTCKCPPELLPEVPAAHVPTEQERLAAWNAGQARRWPSAQPE